MNGSDITTFYAKNFYFDGFNRDIVLSPFFHINSNVSKRDQRHPFLIKYSRRNEQNFDGLTNLNTQNTLDAFFCVRFPIEKKLN